MAVAFAGGVRQTLYLVLLVAREPKHSFVSIWFLIRTLPSSKPVLETGLIQLAQFGLGVGVAIVSILVSDSDVAIQQTRIGDWIDSIGTIWIGCGGLLSFLF